MDIDTVRNAWVEEIVRQKTMFARAEPTYGYIISNFKGSFMKNAERELRKFQGISEEERYALAYSWCLSVTSPTEKGHSPLYDGTLVALLFAHGAHFMNIPYADAKRQWDNTLSAYNGQQFPDSTPMDTMHKIRATFLECVLDQNKFFAILTKQSQDATIKENVTPPVYFPYVEILWQEAEQYQTHLTGLLEGYEMFYKLSLNSHEGDVHKKLDGIARSATSEALNIPLLERTYIDKVVSDIYTNPH